MEKTPQRFGRCGVFFVQARSFASAVMTGAGVAGVAELALLQLAWCVAEFAGFHGDRVQRPGGSA